jgi:circadian clock protein KaiB
MSEGAPIRLRLYVAGDGPNSLQARSNLHALCQQHLKGRHEVEVVDVLREPQRALADGVFLTPMLVKLAPGPARRVAGNLSDPAPLLATLGVTRTL